MELEIYVWRNHDKVIPILNSIGMIDRGIMIVDKDNPIGQVLEKVINVGLNVMTQKLPGDNYVMFVSDGNFKQH